jgi:hypothetical protein
MLKASAQEALLQRLAGAGGVLFVLLWFGHFVFSGGFPILTASKVQLAADYAQSAGRDWTGDHMARLSIVFLLLFLAGLWFVLRRHEAGNGWLSMLAFGSGLLFAGLILIALLFPAVASELGACAGGVTPAAGCQWGNQPVDPYLYSVLYTVAEAVDVLALTPLAVLLGAVAATAIPNRALPPWLSWSAAALAGLVLTASVFEFIFPTFLLFAVWVVATSAVFFRVPV